MYIIVNDFFLFLYTCKTAAGCHKKKQSKSNDTLHKLTNKTAVYLYLNALLCFNGLLGFNAGAPEQDMRDIYFCFFSHMEVDLT